METQKIVKCLGAQRQYRFLDFVPEPIMNPGKYNVDVFEGTQMELLHLGKHIFAVCFSSLLPQADLLIS